MQTHADLSNTVKAIKCQKQMYKIFKVYWWWHLLVEAEKVEEMPADAEEENEDDAEDVSLDDAEEFEEQEVTLDSLVNQFLQGKSIFTISFNLACHGGGSFADHFIVFLCRGNRNVWTLHSDKWEKIRSR